MGSELVKNCLFSELIDSFSTHSNFSAPMTHVWPVPSFLSLQCSVLPSFCDLLWPYSTFTKGLAREGLADYLAVFHPSPIEGVRENPKTEYWQLVSSLMLTEICRALHSIFPLLLEAVFFQLPHFPFLCYNLFLFFCFIAPTLFL